MKRPIRCVYISDDKEISKRYLDHLTFYCNSCNKADMCCERFEVYKGLSLFTLTAFRFIYHQRLVTSID